MTTLVICLNAYFDAGMTGAPAPRVGAMGVAWDEFVPCPMADRIILKGCVNVPETLPEWLTRAPELLRAVAPVRSVSRVKRLCMRSVMEAVEAQRLPVITSNQAAALARELNRKLGL